MRNSDKLILTGLDGIIDAISPEQYTYKDWICDCFIDTFPSDSSYLTKQSIIDRSELFGYTGELHALISGDAAYEEKLLRFIEFTVKREITEDEFDRFMSATKKYYRNIVKYDKIVEYIESLYKACCIGVITDRCWFGCTLLSSILSESKYAYGQFSYMTRYKKCTKEAWDLVIETTEIDKENIIIIDTSEDIIDFVESIGFQAYLHEEDNLTGLSTKINMFLSK